MQVVQRKYFALRDKSRAGRFYIFKRYNIVKEKRSIDMKEKIQALRLAIESEMEQTQTGRALYELKVRFQTELKGIMSGMKDLPKEDRPAFGKIVNEFKQDMEAKFEARALIVKKMEKHLPVFIKSLENITFC